MFGSHVTFSFAGKTDDKLSVTPLFKQGGLLSY